MSDLHLAFRALRHALTLHNREFHRGISGMRIDRALLAIADEYGVDIPEDERTPHSKILPSTVERLTAAVLERHGAT